MALAVNEGPPATAGGSDLYLGEGEVSVSLMLEEIAQQPEALARTIAEERGKVARLGRALREKDVDLIVLVARGSSDNAALFGRYLLEVTTGIPVALAAPSVNTLYGARL